MALRPLVTVHVPPMAQPQQHEAQLPEQVVWRPLAAVRIHSAAAKVLAAAWEAALPALKLRSLLTSLLAVSSP